MMQTISWLVICVAEVAHDRTLEILFGYASLLPNPNYKRYLNEIRKNYKMVMLSTAGLINGLWRGGEWYEIGLYFVWETMSLWFIHELGLSIARGKPKSFGVVGTSHWVDNTLTWTAEYLRMNTTVRLWFNRIVFTVPAAASTYWVFF